MAVWLRFTDLHGREIPGATLDEWGGSFSLIFDGRLKNQFRESIEEWALELQAGCILDLINFQLETSQRMSSRSPGWRSYQI